MFFSLMSDEFKADPYGTFRTLRREAPVCPTRGVANFVVTRYDDVRQILVNHRLFSSSAWAFPHWAVPGVEEYFQSGGMVEQDPPMHTRLRRIVAPVFTPAHLQTYLPLITDVVDELVENLRRQERFDFVGGFSFPLPMAVISRMLDIPRDRREDFKRWSDAVFEMASVGYLPDGIRQKKQKEILQAAREFKEYFLPLIAERRENPGDDLLSRIVQARVDGDYLTDDETFSFARTLLSAGNETTQNMLGNAILILGQRPQLVEELNADPQLLDGFIEEALRYEGPVWGAPRRALADTEIAGVAIPKGTRLWAATASANHDESVFERPEEFDIHRDNRKSMAFGAGVHTCLGGDLALMELRVGLRAMLPVLLEADMQEYRYLNSTLSRGPEYVMMQRRGQQPAPGPTGDRVRTPDAPPASL